LARMVLLCFIDYPSLYTFNETIREFFPAFPSVGIHPLVGSAADDPLDDPIQGVDHRDDGGDVEERRERDPDDDARPGEAAPTEGEERRDAECPGRAADEFQPERALGDPWHDVPHPEEIGRRDPTDHRDGRE